MISFRDLFTFLVSGGVASQPRPSRYPPSQKKREGRGTHCVADASKLKSLGHPPDTVHLEKLGNVP